MVTLEEAEQDFLQTSPVRGRLCIDAAGSMIHHAPSQVNLQNYGLQKANVNHIQMNQALTLMKKQQNDQQKNNAYETSALIFFSQ